MHGLSIEELLENQPTKYKLALYKPPIHLNSNVKQLHISSKMERHNYRSGCGVMHICSHLKEEVALATYRKCRKIRWDKHSRFQPYEVFCGNTFAMHWPSVLLVSWGKP